MRLGDLSTLTIGFNATLHAWHLLMSVWLLLCPYEVCFASEIALGWTALLCSQLVCYAQLGIVVFDTRHGMKGIAVCSP